MLKKGKEEKTMAKESLESITSGENEVRIVYEEPPFYKRAFANLLDIIFLFLMSIILFIAVENIVHVTPTYRHADEIVATYREESGLFIYAPERKTWENVSTWLDNDGQTSYDYRNRRCSQSIDAFISYLEVKFPGQDVSIKLQEDYDESRLSDKLLATDGKHLFVKIDDTDNPGQQIIVENPDLSPEIANSQYYYEHFYREYTLTNCGSYMIAVLPEYHNALTIMSNFFFFLQLPISVILAAFFIYFIPGLFFKHGRMTFGKKIMSIGLVDQRVLSPTIPRFIARWVIFVFGELILSFFTFGIPFIISTTMMAFTKRHQGFPDYMLGLVEIDTTKNKIYMNKYEAAFEHTTNYKGAPEFKMEEEN